MFYGRVWGAVIFTSSLRGKNRDIDVNETESMLYNNVYETPSGYYFV